MTGKIERLDGMSLRQLLMESINGVGGVKKQVEEMKTTVDDLHKIVCGNGVPGLDEKQRATDTELTRVTKEVIQLKKDLNKTTWWAIGIFVSVLGVGGMGIGTFIVKLITHELAIVQIMQSTPHP